METEITVQVFESAEDIINKLSNHGFKITEEIIMIDYYFSKYSKEELKNLEYSEMIKNSFLVRKIVTENECEIKLLYKDKVLDENQNVISEQKISCDIMDIESILRIFKYAGLTCWCELKQNMQVFDNSKTSFVLQNVDDLGLFIEYEEDENMKEFNEYEKMNILLNRLKNLNFKIGEDISCKKVLMKFKKDNAN